MHGFEELPSISAGGGAVVRLWVHSRTGARVRLVETGGPMADLYVVVATEANDTAWAKADDGLPHTLEHLIFLGSESYPFKGVLDKLANRCLARGTNAWTDVDHTAYTVTTAGPRGLLNLLPVFFDHVLRPTITDAGFDTEVHHVTGDGEHKGVVYCEMQGRETTAESLAERACLAELFGGSGYASETGGLCANLRELKADQVRRYHAEYYRAENCCVVVTGGVDAGELLEACGRALDASAPGAVKKCPRPWAGAVPPQLASSKDALDVNGAAVRTARVYFPSAPGETTGLVMLSWRGAAYGAFADDAYESALWLYLADGAASPLARKFVDTGECSGVWPSAERFRIGCHQLWFEDVDVARLDSVDAAFAETLKALVAGGGVDMVRMRECIERAERKTVASLEDEPAAALISPIIKHFCYAADRDDAKDLAQMGDALGLLKAAGAVSKAEWDALLAALTSRRRVCTIARPSAQRAARERDDEAGRLAADRAALGAGGLAANGKRLAGAMAVNEAPPPAAMLEHAVGKVDVGDAVSKMFAVTSVEQPAGAPKPPARRPAYGATRPAALADLEALEKQASNVSEWGAGVRWGLDHVSGTHFCRVDVSADASKLSPKLREYLPLLGEALFKAPVFGDDGVVVAHDDAIAALRRETVSYSAGVSGGDAGEFAVCAKLEGGGAGRGAAIVRRALYQSHVADLDRLRGAVAKLRLELASELRDGSRVARMALRLMAFDGAKSNLALHSAVAQKGFLGRAKFALSPFGRACGARWLFLRGLRDCRAQLFDARNLRARVAGDLLPDVAAVLDGGSALAALTAVPAAAAAVIAPALARAARGGGAAVAAAATAPRPAAYGRCAVVGLAALEGGSAYMARCAPGPASGESAANLAEHAALAVAIEYLTALEGDFWTRIRGAGLAYSASMHVDACNGIILFALYRSTDAAGALDAARSIVADYAARGVSAVRPLDLENARGSLASGLIEAEKTRSAALGAAWRRALRGHKADRHAHFLDAVAHVTVEEAHAAMVRWLVPLFDDAQALTAVVAAPGKLAELQTKLGAAATVEAFTDATLGDLVPGVRTARCRRRAVAGIAAALAAAALVVARRRLA
ncbi:Metalloenzyme, LuxS/M16 peptidase-like protein [Pelagophyceae sp. CCMP2097]|nr:Metalloenzyme, LuxS/M16 peptidase-like protein [Pelagophyceae sp. CCMP2097]